MRISDKKIEKLNAPISNSYSRYLMESIKRRGYYFHADEDFREDHEWSSNGKSKFSSGELSNTAFKGKG